MNKDLSSARERWRRIVQEQHSSGLSVARFCRQRGIGQSSLFAWKRRLAREGGVSKAPAAASASAGASSGGWAASPAFVLVKPAGDGEGDARVSSDGAIELHLGQDRHIVLRPGFDASTLAAALAVLSSVAEGRRC
jgi:hypothetical protein